MKKVFWAVLLVVMLFGNIAYAIDDFSGKWEGEFSGDYAIMKLKQVKRKVTGKMIFYDDTKWEIKGRIDRDGILQCKIGPTKATLTKTDDDTITIYYWNYNTGESGEPEFTRY